MQRQLLVLGATLALLLASASRLSPVRGQAPPTPLAEEAPDPMASVGQVMRLLLSTEPTEGAVRLGMTAVRAEESHPGFAQMLGRRTFDIRGSWLDPEGQLTGIVDWGVDIDTESKVDQVRVVLLTGPYDRRSMRKALVAHGESNGLSLERDEEEPDTWWDPDLWASLGDGIVVLEVETFP